MRVALNGWFLTHSPDTGSGQYLRGLLDWLPRVAPENEYVAVAPAPREGLDASVLNLPPGVSCEAVPASASDLGKVYFEQVLFPRACVRVRADLAHVPYWAPPLRSPVPLVVTIHDVIPLVIPEYRGSFRTRLYTALVSASARGAGLVLTDSDASRDDIVARLGLPPERVRSVPLAADPIFRPSDAFLADAAVRQKHGLPDAYVLYLGGFDARKNLPGLLSAWTWVTQSLGDSYPLVIVGRLPEPDDRMFADLPALAKELNVAETVVFAGPVPKEDLPAVYRGAAVFVYPSRYEGFGLPVLEALACGVPVVASNVSSIPEVVGDAGYLVDPDDTRRLGASILIPIVNPDVAESLNRKALARAAEFTWERTARQTAEAYEVVHHGATESRSIS